MADDKRMREGWRAYETRRVANEPTRKTAAKPPKLAKPPGFFAWLIERSHRPFGP